jgi:hypothetical protein
MKYILALAALAALSSCAGRVVVGPAHVHTAHCGHYVHQGRWHHDQGHVHRHGCGHVFIGGVWRVAD